MGNVYQIATTGFPNLLNMVKTYRSTPVIGGKENLDKVTNAILGKTTIGSGVPIKADTYSEVARSEVSTQMIMAADGTRKWVSDNIAPQPRTWELSGWINAELIGPLAFSNPLLNILIVQARKKVISDLRNSRKTVSFKTVDNELVDVAIVEVAFGHTADAGDAIPITLKLQEVPYLITTELGEASDVAQAAPEAGTEWALPNSFGKVQPSSTQSGITFPSWMGS